MKIYPFLCRNASYCFMFCADRTDRQSTRKRSKKSFPHSLSIFTIRCHTSMPKNGHGSDDPCAERTELGRNRQHPRRWPLPYCCCMVPSRQKTLSIPAPYRCHIRPMPDHSNCDLDTTQSSRADLLRPLTPPCMPFGTRRFNSKLNMYLLVVIEHTD